MSWVALGWIGLADLGWARLDLCRRARCLVKLVGLPGSFGWIELGCDGMGWLFGAELGCLRGLGCVAMVWLVGTGPDWLVGVGLGWIELG